MRRLVIAVLMALFLGITASAVLAGDVLPGGERPQPMGDVLPGGE